MEKETIRNFLLNLLNMSTAELEQYASDITTLGLSEEWENWLFNLLKELVNNENQQWRNGFIRGIIENNDLNS
jgi:hypothetical protein